MMQRENGGGADSSTESVVVVSGQAVSKETANRLDLIMPPAGFEGHFGHQVRSYVGGGFGSVKERVWSVVVICTVLKSLEIGREVHIVVPKLAVCRYKGLWVLDRKRCPDPVAEVLGRAHLKLPRPVVPHVVLCINCVGDPLGPWTYAFPVGGQEGPGLTNRDGRITVELGGCPELTQTEGPAIALILVRVRAYAPEVALHIAGE